MDINGKTENPEKGVGDSDDIAFVEREGARVGNKGSEKVPPEN